MRRIQQQLNSWLEHPVKIGISALALAFAGLLSEGTLLDLWNLQKEKAKIQGRLDENMKTNEDLKMRIERAQNSDKFIGKQAREKLDLVRDDELVFIFENEPTTR